MRTKEVLPHRIKVDLGVMTTTLLKAPNLKPYHRIQFSIIAIKPFLAVMRDLSLYRGYSWQILRTKNSLFNTVMSRRVSVSTVFLSTNFGKTQNYESSAHTVLPKQFLGLFLFS